MPNVPDTADTMDLLVQGTYLHRGVLARSGPTQRRGAARLDRRDHWDDTPPPIVPVTDSRSALGGSPGLRLA